MSTRVAAQARFTEYAESIRPSSIRALEVLAAANKDLIAFGPGRPDDSLFPIDVVKETWLDTLGDRGRAANALQYAASEGMPDLRTWLAARERRLGRKCEPENVLITSGSQQAIHLVTKLLVERGDEVVVQAPTYPGALQIFWANGARPRSLDEVRHGPSGARPAMIYAMADFQNPTGACLSLAERHELVALARRHDTYLVEDNAYEVLRYEGEAAPSLMDVAGGSPDEGKTILIGSFSKCAAPGLRLGWVVGPREIVARLTLIKQTEDLQASTLAQSVIARIADHIFGPQAQILRENYRQRRDLMLDALRQHVGGKAVWKKPEGGFFIWLELDRRIDTFELMPKAIDAGVAYVPGSAFFHDHSGSNYLRLSFSAVERDRIEVGIRRLGKALEH